VNLSNFTLNLSIPGSQASCFQGGAVSPECIIRGFCPQLPAYFSSVALWLLLAYVVIDFIIPLIFTRVNLGAVLDRLYGHNPAWAKILDLRNQGEREGLVIFLKDRLLFAFAILAGYLLYFFRIQH